MRITLSGSTEKYTFNDKEFIWSYFHIKNYEV